MYNEVQEQYAALCGQIVNSFANKRAIKPTPDETKIFNDWYVRPTTNLLRDKDSYSVNAGLLWCCTLKYNSAVTPEFLDACNRSAELAGLLLRPAAPTPQVLTAAGRAEAEEGLARLEPMWRGTGRDSSGSPYAVRYDTPDNLDRMIQRVNAEGVLVTDATLLLAFKYLLAEKQLAPIAREQRKTHDAPATQQSVRDAQQANAQQHKDQRGDVQAIRKLRAEFSRDYAVVENYRGTGPGGQISHAATFSGQVSGFAELKKLYDGKFTGELAPTYDQLMADLEKKIQKHSPSGGAIRVYDKDAQATVKTAGSFADVMTQLPKQEPSKRTNRDAFGEGALPANAPFPPLRK